MDSMDLTGSLTASGERGLQILVTSMRIENKPDCYRLVQNANTPDTRDHINLSEPLTMSKPASHKTVNTTLSSIDLVAVNEIEYIKEIRRIKSQEDPHVPKPQNNDEDDIIEWLAEVNSVKKIKRWAKRLKTIADKLKKPGDEEMLKDKIEKYLKKFPSQFSECDQNGKEFREKLPDNLVKKLKKLSNTIDRDTPVNVYRLEIPEYDKNNFNDCKLKTVLRNWLLTLPVKKKDFLDRNIKNEELLEYLLNRLRPFVLHIPTSHSDYTAILKSYLTEIVYEIPIDINCNNKNYYMNGIIDKLIDAIIYIHSEATQLDQTWADNINRTEPINDYDNSYDYVKDTEKAIKDFVTDEITYYLENTDIGFSRKIMEYIEYELTEILMGVLQSTNCKTDGEKMEEISSILKEIGHLSEYQAAHFSNVLYQHFKEVFNVRHKGSFAYNYRLDRSTDLSPDISEQDVKANQELYMRQIINQFKEWLVNNTNDENLRLYQKSALQIAEDLARDIVDKQRNPASKCYLDEPNHLRLIIFKWVGKLFGEDTMEVFEHAQDLMMKIKSIPVPILMKPHGQLSRDLRIHNGVKRHIEELARPVTCIEKLYEKILDWYRELPLDLQMTEDDNLREHFVRNLAETIERCTEENQNPVEAIDREVDWWISRVLRNKPRKYKIIQLKESLEDLTINYYEVNEFDVKI